MKTVIRRLHPSLRAACAAAVLLATAVSGAARADSPYPSKPIEIIVASSAGGILDTIARTAAHGIERLGQPAVVKNLPGGGGTIGTQAVARAAGDGYTLGRVATSHAINPSMYAKLLYDTSQGFTNVTQMVELTNFLVANPSVPASNLKELIALAKAGPGTLTHGSAGVGSPTTCPGNCCNRMLGIKLVHVPYRAQRPGPDRSAGRLAVGDVRGRAVGGTVREGGQAEADRDYRPGTFARLSGLPHVE